MAETVVERAPERLGPCEVTLLTTYPHQDGARAAEIGVQVVGLQPARLALVEIPVAVLVLVARMLRLPTGWVRTRGCRALLDADVAVDVAGISFVDGRGVPITVYNALMTGLPLLLGRPTVKLAQALGPFATIPNKWLARLVLPRLAAVCARGARTRAHCEALGLANVSDVADLAFGLDEAGVLPESIESAVARVGDHAVVMPSAVVRRLFAHDGNAHHVDYVAAMVALVRDIRARTGLAVVIAPHSYRMGEPEGRMNDGPVCREIAQALVDDDGIVLVDADLTAGQLRRLVSGSRVLVTSRFHAMISGLATATPTIVIGWSHKYREVLDDFGLAEFGVDSAALVDPTGLGASVADAVARHDEISARIRAALPAVRERSARNVEVLAVASGARS